jgi:uncharacterized protein with NRDE domain
MCLITFGLRKHPDYFLVMAANRDEFYERPTESSHWWQTDPNILAGKDQKAGGTWMGVNDQGFWAAITNVRAPGQYREDAPSRGNIVKNYLLDAPNPKAYLNDLAQEMGAYNGFNLLVGTATECWYLTNSMDHDQPTPLAVGLHGLSNAQLNVPWPKVTRACNQLEERLNSESGIATQDLLDDMVDQTEAPEEELPDTGVDTELEKKLSAMFIQTPKYGTRCSTALTIGYDGTVRWHEQSYRPGSLEVASVTEESFTI